MQITKCDQCHKVKPKDILSFDKEASWVSGRIQGQGIGYSFDLCASCGKSVILYIKKFFGFKNKDVKK